LDPVKKSKLQALNEKYTPIEWSQTMSVEEKIPHMVDWWTKSHDLIAQSGFQKRMLDDFVKDANVELRDNSGDFFRITEESVIPILVFSAGLGDLIDILFKQRMGKVPSNVHTISNFMEFDTKGIITGFRDPLIHVFNKNATVIQGDHKFFDQLKLRPNVLLMGDSLGDLHMDVGIANEGSTVLKIGFFNKEVTETSLKPYLSGYDLVLVNDQTFDVPLAILKAIIGEAKKTF